MEFIPSVTLLILVSLAFLYAGGKFRVPSVVCFLAVGVLVGPFGLGVIRDSALVGTFGEIGVILLLFTIGLELSVEDIARYWRVILLGGTLQVCTTIVVIASITSVLGFPFNEAVFFGFLVSLSSTAIVMRVLQERGEVESLEGTTLLGILVFQDLAIIPMILITPLLMGREGPSYEHLPLGVAKVALILAAIVIAAVWLIPALLDRVARERNRELFLLSIAAICFAVATLTSAAGLSLSLGAFIAGLVVGESEYSLAALSDILPFRDLFAGIFFLSVGMLLDVRVLLAHFPVVASVILTIFSVKFLTGWLSVASIGLPPRVAVLAGLSLCQIGEFSFVLANAGLGSGLITLSTYQVFLSGAVVTMAATPFLMGAAGPVTRLLSRGRPAGVGTGEDEGGMGPPAGQANHAVIAGLGVAGEAVARAAEIAGVPCHAIALDPGAAGKGGEGLSFTYGDATRDEVLLHAGIDRAAFLFVALPEERQAEIVIRKARRLSPGIRIVALADSPGGAAALREAGADEAISSGFEGALRLFSRALSLFGLEEGAIGPLVSRVRAHLHRAFSAPAGEGTLPGERRLGDHRIFRATVGEGSAACGRPFREVEAALPPGVAVVGIEREGKILGDIPGDLPLARGDTLVFFGPPGRAAEVRTLVTGPG